MTKQTIRRIKLAFHTSNGITEFAFHLGYQQFFVPKMLRRLLAKTALHRAWHSGYYGGGILGILDRKIEENYHEFK
jgi:hypothetical protein